MEDHGRVLETDVEETGMDRLPSKVQDIRRDVLWRDQRTGMVDAVRGRPAWGGLSSTYPFPGNADGSGPYTYSITSLNRQGLRADTLSLGGRRRLLGRGDVPDAATAQGRRDRDGSNV